MGVEADVIRLALHVPVDASIVECAGIAIEGMRDDVLALLTRILRQDVDLLHLGESDARARIVGRPAVASANKGSVANFAVGGFPI